MGTNFKESTDASVWAKAFVEHKERNEWALDNIDEDLMVGWFANFWSACQLEHDKTKAQLDRAMEVVERLCPAHNDCELDDCEVTQACECKVCWNTYIKEG